MAGLGNTPMDFVNSIPTITRTLAGCCLLSTILVQLGLLSPYHIYLDWSSLLKLQVWRLVTNFLFLGKFSFSFVIQMIWLIQYGKALESQVFQFNTADHVFMLLFGAITMLAASFVLPWPVYFLGTSLVFMQLYVWSRHFPMTQVSLFGLVNLQAFYLPFAFLCLSIMMGKSWVSDLMGIIAGHLYYFLKVLHPAAGGRSLIDTPDWL